jgi:hypothetical protein
MAWPLHCLPAPFFLRHAKLKLVENPLYILVAMTPPSSRSEPDICAGYGGHVRVAAMTGSRRPLAGGLTLASGIADEYE